MSCLFHRITDHLTNEVILTGISQSCHLCVTETMIDKGWMPPASLFTSVGIVTVGTLRMTEILHPDIPCTV